MLIIKLFGGLGNQIFQYAFGRQLALKNNVPLYLDTFSGFQNDFYKRSYSLSIFDIKAQIASSKTVERILKIQSPLGRKQQLFVWLDTHILGFNPLFINEKHYHFDAEVLQTKSFFAYVSGYWQSEKYFQDIALTIRQDLTFLKKISSENQSLLDSILSTNSVCLHLRRLHGIAGGQTNAEGVKFHGASEMTYYDKALEIIAQKEHDLHFFVFADDPIWAKENIKLPYPTTFVSGNADYEDLQLMSQCKHHIIANSSFSWWSAWLNPNPYKVVIAPDDWFKDKNINTKDIYPASWYRV
jgi:hypothetical protein